MNEQPQFSVIVLSRNPQINLHEFIERLCAFDLDFDRFECIIVGDGVDMEKFFPDHKKEDCRLIRFLKNRIENTVDAWNRAVEQSRGEILVFTEDDVILHPDFFKTLETEIASLGDRVIGGGKVIPVFENQKPPWMIKFFMPLLDEVNYGETIRPFPKKAIPRGMNMVIGRKYFERYGVFEENNTGKPEIRPEFHFFNRLKRDGISFLYFPNLMVWHIIPPEHLSRSFIRRQAEINLVADLYSAQISGKSKWWRLVFKELSKWLASLIIAFYYLFTTQWEKIKPLFQYRYWRLRLILRNIFSKTEK